MSAGYDEWLESHEHPLLNNVILDIVFKNLRGKELKECRLVCKTWNELTIPFTRNAFEIKIVDNNSMEKFVDVLRSNTTGIPFARFLFGSSMCLFLTEGINHDFLQLCGATIKSIRSIGSGAHFLVRHISELLKSTPRLEIFESPRIVRCSNFIKLFLEGTSRPKLQFLKKLIVSDYSVEERNVYCPTYLEELITSAPNISSLHLTDFKQKHLEIVSSSLDVLKIIEGLGRESSIQELILEQRSRNYAEYFDILHKMVKKRPNGLKLKSFEYVVKNSEESQGLFKLISFFKNTLQYLKITSSSHNTFALFQKMSFMKKLDILYKNVRRN